ncbi:HAD family hydrolase [Croceicoccus ponticola]|uniref:HAD family hydrolase n=1 Tax=Croceicoccus ponticola TaxID=2217664 RepID=A0A437H2I6_9SPHN|nr:HAD family hydrolase [Croceicoccus ponticola]RVQ69692.1 HAD family hydrolase [Croceicoccus ponticola]
MNKPLIITDCDEVLLRMVVHFRDWLGEEHGVDLDLTRGWAEGMRRRGADEPMKVADMWTLLDGFFDTQMGRQDPIPGAVEAMAALSDHAEIVVLTNLPHHRQNDRVRQLRGIGIDVPVYCNQGPKGPALQKIMVERGEGRPAVFIDDLAIHIGSVAEVAPHVSRLHFVGEPGVAPHTTCALEAGHAHARIDQWAEAVPWLMQRIGASE